MKKAVLILVAGFMAMEAYAQAPDTTSTVVGRKLNFEAPVFGLSERDIKPAWSVVMLDEAAGGLNYMLGIPGEIKPAGIFADLSLVALRHRPWKDGNVFSAGLLFGVNYNRLEKGYAFADNGSIIPTPATWERTKSYYSDYHVGLQVGYAKEFGDWKAGAFLVPAFETTHLSNVYSVQGLPGIDHTDFMDTNYRFHLGFKVGVWYQDIGVSLGYKPVLWRKTGAVPMYHSLQLGISARY